MLPEQQQRILGYFIEEAKDHLNTIEQGLLALQNTIDDPEMLKEVYRAAHSVKGGAGMLGYSSIQKTAHLLEDCFKILEGSPVRVDQKLEALFLRVFDTLQSLVEQLQGPFGLPEDVAASLMSTTAPVFSELQQHLDVLTKQPGGGAKVGAKAPAKEKEQLQVAFKQEVMEALRQMLQLFRPPQWPNSRQELVSRCEGLQQLGDRFNLTAWSNLLACAAGACGNPDNSSQTLAPVIIKEIKQAQELVLAGRGAEIAVSQELVALAPPPSTAEAAIESDLEDLLAATGDDDDAVDWFQSAIANTPEVEMPESAEDLFDAAFEPDPEPAQFFFEPEPEVNPSKTTGRSERNTEKPSITAPADPTGPEVGAAELNSLADLFPEEVPELDSTWQVEEAIGDGQNQPSFETFDDFNEGADNELADLFISSSTESLDDESPEDDTVTLFGKAFLDDDGEDEPVASGNQGAAEPQLTDLFNEDFPAATAAQENEDRSLFGEDFSFDDSEDEPVAAENQGAVEPQLTDLFDEDFPAATAVQENEDRSLFGEDFSFDDSEDEPVASGNQGFPAAETATAQEDEDRSLFGEDFFFNDSGSEPAGAGLPSTTAASQGETDDLSELFAGLNEDDIWQAESNEPEDLGSVMAESAELSDGPASGWLEDWSNTTAAPSAEQLDLAGFDASSADFGDWQGDLSATPSEAQLDLAGFDAAAADFGDWQGDLSATPSEAQLDLAGFDAAAADFGDWQGDLSATPSEAQLDLAGFDAAAADLGDWQGDLSAANEESLPQAAESAAPNLTGTEFESEDLFQSDAEALTPDLSFDDADFSFSTPEQEAAALLNDESGLMDLPELDQNWAAPTQAEAETFEFGALTDDLDLGTDDLFGSEATTEDPPTPSQSSQPEVGANAEASFDDFFSLDQPAQLWGEPSEEPAELGMEANWLEASSADLFADMETPTPGEVNLGLEEPAADGSDSDFDLFGDEEPAAALDLFSSEIGAADEAFAIADNSGDLNFDLPPAESESAADDDLDWISQITEDVPDDELELTLDVGENAESAAIEADAGDQFLFDQLDLGETGTGELEEVGDFADLEAMLGEPSAAVATEAESDATTDLGIDFDDLEAMLGEDAIATADDTPSFDTAPAIVSAAAATTSKAPQAKTTDTEFAELEEMLGSAEKLGGPPMKTRPGQAATSKPRARIFEQTMKVPVKQLDNLTNLVGELVVNRNSLEQDQERLRQFLDNLLHQVQQLSDVGARMQDLYERSLLESALLASRQSYRFSTSPLSTGGDASNGYSSGSTWDHIEMDRFTPFHSLSQEMIELIVRVRESASDIEFIVDETDQVSRQFRQVTTQLQEGLTRARMVPFSEIERVFPLFRYVRDKAAELGKQAELRIEGRETLIDKLILEHLSDPMKHLINNGLAHGIESPEIRQAAGKPPIGRITLSAFHQGNQTVISFTDDGAGIDVERLKAKAVEKRLLTAEQARSLSRIEAYELLYLSGLSTKDKADLIAGKGVGMDVVRTNVSEIRGTITTDSNQGKGTSFTIRLPLTLSICKALCCVSDQARIAFPMDGVEDALDVPKTRVQMNSEGQPYIQWRDMQLVFKPLHDLLAYNRQLGRGRVYGATKEDDSIAIVVLRSAGNFLAIQVDQVVGEQEIVIKQLEGPVPKPIGIAGATVMGDGRIMPIGDVLELIDIAMGRVGKDRPMLWEQNNLPAASEVPVNEPRVLIVDDSITVRELLSMTFNKAGYRVEQARDGQEAWDKLKSGLPCDIVFCDIEMPRMDGLELLSRMHKDPELTDLPVAMLTSRGAEKHRQMAFELGASGYFTKPYLEEALLDAASRMLKGEKLVTTNISASPS